MPLRAGSVPWVPFVLGLMLLTAMTVGLLAPTAANAKAGGPCNGSVDLCDRSLDQVVLPGTHNSMSAAELDWLRPNQTYSIPNQLERGVRAMLIDTYYGRARTKDDGSVQVENVSKEIGRTSGADMYLCHVVCQLGATELIPELRSIRDFLAANPREVMVFVNEDNIAPADFARAVEESGLIDFIYQGPTDEWPTLDSMIRSGQRVLMLAQSDVGAVPWYHLAYEGPMRETPYSFPDAASLTAPGQLDQSCRPLRGGNDGSLFLMNHWVSRMDPPFAPPQIEDAQVVNTSQALVARARACDARRGILPTILAVDFFGAGDVVGAARELNGVEAEPFLTIAKLKRVKVRAGRRAALRVRVSNIGDATANGVRACASVPRRLARKPRCKTIASLPPGSTETARLRIKAKRKARGRGKIRIKLRPPAGQSTSKANLRVKPARSSRRN